jgi:hypothetical protein
VVEEAMDRTVHPVGKNGEIELTKAVSPIDDSKQEDGPLLLSIKRKMYKFINCGEMQLFLGMLLMLSLFMADSWTLGNARDDESDGRDGTLLFVFIVFCVESIILTFVQPGYFMGFFMWMDVLGTFSIVLDISWIADSFLPQNGGNVKAQGSVLRATRAAKLGARYGRLMRILKLMKFIDYLPCLKKKNADDAASISLSALRKVTNQLIQLVSQRIAFLTMLLVIVLPFLSYSSTDYSTSAWIDTIKNTCKFGTYADASRLAEQLQSFYKDKDRKVISTYFECYNQGSNQDFDETYNLGRYVQSSNKLLYESYYGPSGSSSKSYTVSVIMDTSHENQMNAMFSILIIILVIICLIGFSASFQFVIEKLMVVPLERMMNTLRNSATLMLKNLKAMEEEKNDKENVDNEDDFNEELETDVLEKLVDKLAKIVKNVLPGANDIIIEDKNVDSATASWLSNNFSQVSKKVINSKEKETAASMRHRMSELNKMKTAVDPVLLNSWNFDVLKYSSDELSDIISYIFVSLGLFESVNINQNRFSTFVKYIFSKYLDNTYHNFKHGVDVCHTTYRLLAVPGLIDVFTSLEITSILIGALAHDVGHPGVNNLYLVKAKDKLALLHNDKSPLENMHCALLYETLAKAEYNIFENFTEQQWRDSRKMILTIVLATDMMHHFEQISKTQLFLEVNGEDIKKFCRGEKDTIDCFGEETNRLFVAELVLHASDISNPYKPFSICAAWADLVVEEFSRQGDREKRENLEVSPMMDRNTIVICNMQMGFIEFVVTPLINSIVNLFPPLNGIATQLATNYSAWGEKRKLELMDDPKCADKPGECAKLDDRINKFKEKQSFANAYASLNVRSVKS